MTNPVSVERELPFQGSHRVSDTHLAACADPVVTSERQYLQKTCRDMQPGFVTHQLSGYLLTIAGWGGGGLINLVRRWPPAEMRGMNTPAGRSQW